MNELLAQNAHEFSAFLGLILGKRSLLEIGSRYGESLKMMARYLRPWSKVVSIDVGYDVEHPTENTLERLNQNISELKTFSDVTLVIGDSHDKAVVERVRNIGPFDIVFIDGDHSMTGVSKDFENYGPMGKIVAFHDIKLETIAPLWRKLKEERRWMEINDSATDVCMGIGVVFND